ncbi:MAG TPA: VWA domain-containing protein [Geminicoccaceae bacterium]|nr:VWA domain-containing protein [Geminicoccus sp.]HMU50641.1 VWA domain-containing protein [Geminicoccaceae bacterium]
MSLAVLEYEEQFGRLWHRLVGTRASLPRFPQAAVRLEDERKRLAVLFRGLGGDPGLELVAGGPATSRHRLRLAQRLGMADERLALAERTSQLVLLPPMLDCLPTAGLNRDLYVWLVAFLAGGERHAADPDPLRRDIMRLRAAASRTAAVLAAFPGLRRRHARLGTALLALRPERRLPPAEAAVESAIRHLHGDMSAGGPIVGLLLSQATDLSGIATPRGYRPFLPSPLWGEIRDEAGSVALGNKDGAQPGSETAGPADDRHRRARRRTPAEENRRDPLTLINKGEYLLLAAEAAGVSRPEDDDDPEAARHPADDMDELTLGSPERRAASRVRLELDMPGSAAVSSPPLAMRLTYPEWDWHRERYRPGYCAVWQQTAPENGEDWVPDPAVRRHIAHVRRRFEALRPRRELRRAQPDGGDLDMDAIVRVRTDLAAGAAVSDRVYVDAGNQARDLVTAILVDSSFSTDSWIEGRRVLDVEKAALTALAFGLEACGDPFAILTFSSHRRQAVAVRTVKEFAERMGEPVRRRIAALRPSGYTRIGAAMRHVGALLDQRPERHRLLLLLSDGKPNDLDHYEGRYAVEDCRKAVQELRARGQAVFAVTVDRRAEGYVPRIFGRGGYAIVGHLGRLPDALPAIYRQLVA